MAAILKQINKKGRLGLPEKKVINELFGDAFQSRKKSINKGYIFQCPEPS
jgi:hypothetical protein